MPAPQEKPRGSDRPFQPSRPSSWQGLMTEGRGDGLPLFLCTLSAGTDVGGVQDCTGHGGRRLLKHTRASPPALPTGCLPSASSRLGVREGGLCHCPHLAPPPFLFLETKWPQFSTLVPVCFTCFSQSHKTPASRKHNADTLPRQPSPLPPFPEYAIALVPVCRPGPLLCMRRPLPSAQRRCCVCPGGHILYIYFLLQSLSL